MSIALHVSTAYSFGRCQGDIPAAVELLQQEGVTAAGIVDTGTWGHVAWYQACKAAGITPLLGCSVALDEGGGMMPRMWFLACDAEGLAALYALVSLSYRSKVATPKGPRPATTREAVAALPDGVLIFAGDMTDADFLSSLAARRGGGVYADIVENGSLISNAAKQKLPLPMVHIRHNTYLRPQDRPLLSLLPGGRQGLSDTSLCPPQQQDAAAEEIVQRCAALALPQAPVLLLPGGARLAAHCMAAVSAMPEAYRARCARELGVIRSKGFESYFCLVADLMAYCRSRMLCGPARGSAAGSLVCYLTGITVIDPIVHGLYFERFLDESRDDMPDIDIDLPDGRRGEAIAWLRQHYHTAHVGNVLRYGTRSLLNECIKKLGLDDMQAYPLKQAVWGGSSMAEAAALLPENQQLAAAAGLENHPLRTGTHAAGMIVSQQPLNQFCAVTDKDVACLDKRDIEELGLLKIDLLGLRTLTVLNDALPGFDFRRVPLDDPGAFSILQRGLLCGVFQFEAASMRQAARAAAKAGALTCFDDVMAVTALSRPGPMSSGLTAEWIARRSGRKRVPEGPLKELLPRTCGLPLYQEDTMLVCRELGRLPWPEVHAVRRASAKGKALPPGIRERFIAAAAERCGGHAAAAHVWDAVTGAGGYQMNRAHTCAYAMVSIWCLYVKAGWPLQYAAAVLNNVKDEVSAVAYLREMTRCGTPWVWFDPLRSQEGWSVQQDRPGHSVVIGGFTAIAGCGPAKAQRYMDARRMGNDMSFLLQQPSPYKGITSLPQQPGVTLIDEIPENPVPGSSAVILGRVRDVSLRDSNDPGMLLKRNGRRLPFAQRFMDLTVEDDTGSLRCRVRGADYARLHGNLLHLKEGAVARLDVVFYNGHRFGFVRSANKVKGL